MTANTEAVRSVVSATDDVLTALKELGKAENRLSQSLAKGVDKTKVDAVSSLTRRAMTELPPDLWATLLGALEKYGKTMAELDQVLRK
ncbi:hypothetical protein [Mycolicibacter arupensis]|jgi:hypothetical protein|uniref:hypothetical protein n=1 Tax=Mycolicibacter arupensis TaxID=342002 RepID=UPI00122CE23E|nr:hypothetical protein [Mycolicibacter arupensis]KAA1428628.1 hypothetical protein F0402_19050 [Mycolicibacter arupensis]